MFFHIYLNGIKHLVVMHEYFPKLLHLKVKIFNFLHNFSRKNQWWNKYEILGITPPGHKKSEKNFIGALTPTPHAHIGARIQPRL